ncbi:DUF2332 family protein [Paenibacillus sp. D51F]
MELFRFAENECRGSSPLYECLAVHIARDKELLKLASFCGEGQPVPNLLLGAVHYLLLSGFEHNLREFYGSMTEAPRSFGEAFPRFKSFCRLHRHELIPIGSASTCIRSIWAIRMKISGSRLLSGRSMQGEGNIWTLRHVLSRSGP